MWQCDIAVLFTSGHWWLWSPWLICQSKNPKPRRPGMQEMHRAVAQWDALQTANYKFGPGSQHDPNEVNLSCHKWKRRKRWIPTIRKYLSYSNKFRPQLVGKTHHRGSGSVSLAWPPACNLRSILRLPPKLKWKPHFLIRVRVIEINSV